MSLFKGTKENHVFASPLAGQLVANGEPLKNVTLTRTIFSNTGEDTVAQQFQTDEAGFFNLPAYEKELEISPLAQFSASYNIEANINGEKLLIWYASKLEPTLYEETGTEPVGLICDITHEEKSIYSEESVIANIITRCQWK